MILKILNAFRLSIIGVFLILPVNSYADDDVCGNSIC